MWGNLEDAIREGTNRWQQTFGWDGPIFSNFFRTEESMREFLMAMHGYGLISSPHVVAAFDLSRFRRLVDLGGATGHLAIAACERYPGHASAVVFDLPEAGPLAREIRRRLGRRRPDRDRLGRLLRRSASRGRPFRVGRILHDWTEAKVLTLLQRIFDRLPSGGGLLIAEKLISEDRTGPRWAHMQNLGMLLYTEGKERTLSEYRVGFSSRVGFSPVQRVNDHAFAARRRPGPEAVNSDSWIDKGVAGSESRKEQPHAQRQEAPDQRSVMSTSMPRKSGRCSICSATISA